MISFLHPNSESENDGIDEMRIKWIFLCVEFFNGYAKFVETIE
jgi:hypothetical protein